MSERWDITVMLGGPSAEREVSLASGWEVVGALRSLEHRVTELDPQPGAWSLPGRADVVFLALHGTYGEDGTIQRELDALGVPYTGCGAEASERAFDKVISKRIFEFEGVPTAAFAICEEANQEVPGFLSFPLVLKPARQGSSMGVEIVKAEVEWESAMSRVGAFGGSVLVEEFIEGREITVGIVDNEVFPIVEVRPKSGYYDYHNKYTSAATEYACPASFDSQLTEAINRTAKAAFKAIGGGMYARIDMIVRDQELFVLEVNTLPGMTETSLLPKSAAAAGVPFPDLCHRLAALALEESASYRQSCVRYVV
ncbi:MAG: D-alanine--D-alanine ligase [Verrucomicrobia subdivision 3 bacterium]|nr:D-alanine--D-alanine ligase [Limisphaerales bacterium]MCS1412389.1 D-alanine--D-alanine ligase [Limisphaerales bacterium]